MKKNLSLICILSVALFSMLLISCENSKGKLKWPAITQETKPWTRWWWMGSAVSENDLANSMKELNKVGIGGVEITPIYGVKGYEDKFIDYLSPQWVDILLYTLDQGQKLDLGIDMATGTGWPFGGPWVNEEDACKYFAFKKYEIKKGKALKEKIEYIQKPIVRPVRGKVDYKDLVDPVRENKKLQELALDQVRFIKPLPLQVLMAYSDKGEVLDLTIKVDQAGQLDWVAPDGNWTLYAVFQGWHGKMVERAAPGGETNVIDHFSKKALENYLKKFDQAFEGKEIQSLRAFFNDSYEVDDARGEANWTPGFFEEFEKRRGYDLKNHLDKLFSPDTSMENLRVLCDYRETISDLLLENFTQPWREWGNSKNALIRNQAHGSPANILDLYAASDIPEAEGTDIWRTKFASSAANISGKKLVSAEACTWLDEHFNASLQDAKDDIDWFFLGGVNHVFYHGTTFSPSSENWPGWMFYASVHFGQTNSFWNDFPKLNDYIAKCQSFLQDGDPANDILLYFPIYDKWSKRGIGMLQHFRGGAKETPARQPGITLYDDNFSFDYISDAQIKNLGFSESSIITGNMAYKTLILPECKFIPLQTFEKIMALAKEGAQIIVEGNLPLDVPGYADLTERQAKYKELVESLEFTELDEVGNTVISKATIGKGAFFMCEDIRNLLDYMKIERILFSDKGLKSVKRINQEGEFYFVANLNGIEFDGWYPIPSDIKAISHYNPMTGESGMAKIQSNKVYLQLQSRETCILKTHKTETPGPQIQYYRSRSWKYPIQGEWTVDFIEGGPFLPGQKKTNTLGSWTDLGGPEVKSFSGTAKYTIEFQKPDKQVALWILDLGRVCESASVKLNGKELGTLITTPFRVFIPDKVLKQNNVLEVEVSNLMANRIAYMDKNDMQWKKFYNINFPARKQENRGEDELFSARDWQPMESGIFGPVSIEAVEIIEFY